MGEGGQLGAEGLERADGQAVTHSRFIDDSRFSWRKYLHIVQLMLIAVAFVFSGCSSDEEKKASHFEKGKSYFEKGEYKSAELEFRNAIQIDPEFVDAYERLGETYLKLGDPRGAFREYSMVAKLDPDNIDASSSWPRFT
jgi:Tfp pilus assembly protein PilF